VRRGKQGVGYKIQTKTGLSFKFDCLSVKTMTGRKGISPLIAAVLLIAFTMAVGSIFAQWAPNLLQSTQQGVSDDVDQITGCNQARLEVSQVRQEGDGDIKFSFQVNGDTELENFTAGLLNDDGRAQAEQITTDGLSNNELKTVSLKSPDTGNRFTDLRLSSNNCPNQVEQEIELDCPSGFAGIDELGGFCIMKYEASHQDATSSSDGSSSVAASQQGVVPWEFVTYHEARDACQAMGTGYNLTTNKQWQAATEAVIGQPDTFVHGNNDYGSAWEDSSESGTDDPTETGDDHNWLDEGRVLTGTGPDTWATSEGVYDLNGNMWEWVYVTSGDSEGTVDQSHPMHFGGTNNWVNGWNSTGEYPTDLASSSNSSFDDYYWSSSNDNRAVRRGGHWTSGRYAGPFAMYVIYAPSDSGARIGFRCSY
jgi:flagellin-like protein